jgi:hypothetical protein
MSHPFSRDAAALFWAGLIAMVMAGCTSNSDGGGTVGFPFSVEFGAMSGNEKFVIFQDPRTGAVLPMEQAPDRSSVGFENPPWRATMTIAEVTVRNGVAVAINLCTYENIHLQGTWHYGSAAVPHVGGVVMVDISYPKGDYQRLHLAGTGMAEEYVINPEDSTGKSVCLGYCTRDDAGNISLYGSVSGQGQGCLGWLLDRPFAGGGTTTFALALNKPGTWRTVTPSRQLDRMGVVGYRRMSGDEGLAFGDYYAGQVGFPWRADFPARRWCMYGEGYFQDNGFQYRTMDSVLHDNFTVPDIGLSAEYNALSGEYRNVQTTQPVDLIECVWTVGDSTGIWGRWLVDTDGQTSTVHPPTLPDSVVRAWFHCGPLGLHSLSVTAEDWGDISDYDQCIHRDYMSDTRPEDVLGSCYRIVKHIPAIGGANEATRQSGGASRFGVTKR